MKNEVTAQVAQMANIRRERVKIALEENLPGTFVVLDDQKRPRQFFFKDEHGDPIDTFIIHNLKKFNLDDAIDKHNWEVLKIFIAKTRGYSARIILNNPGEAAEQQINRDMKIFEIHKELQKIQSSKDEVVKLFRRVVGVTSGISNVAMYNKLWQTAKETPEKFQIDGKSIFENEDYHLYSLIDLAIEKGALLKVVDPETKQIIGLRQRSGGIIAKSIDLAVYELKTNPELKKDVEFMANETPKPVDKAYVLEIDDKGLAQAMDQFGVDIQKTPVNPDSSINELQVDLLFEEQLEGNIEALIKGGFIVEKGKKFMFPTMPKMLFTRDELSGHFKNNKPHYNTLKQQAELK